VAIFGRSEEAKPMKLITRTLAGGAATLGLAAGFAGTASAGPVTQQGLVNLNLSGITVQVPVTVAANLCDVNVGVLIGQLRDDGDAHCQADAVSGAVIPPDAITIIGG
jgi:hypothetical protein